MVVCESRCNGLNVRVTDHGAWINGKRVWPRRRRSWLAVLRRWRRMYPSGWLWAWRRPIVVQIMIDGEGRVMIQCTAAEAVHRALPSD